MKLYIIILAYVIIPLVLVRTQSNDEPKTFQSSPFITSSDSQYGPLIEAASVDRFGEAFATNFNNQSFQIGRIVPEQKFYHASTNTTSYFNGIRFLPLSKDDTDKGIRNIALVADVIISEVSKVTEMNDGTTTQVTFCKDSTFVKPNDLALSPKTGRIYVSGQNYTPADTVIGDGGLWLCYPDGKSTRLLTLGRTNGIELSPDEKTLYLSEAFNKNQTVISNKIWEYQVDPNTGQVSPPELFVDFEKLDGTQAIDIDGMRTDVKGNLYVTRHGGQQVVMFSPDKKVLARIKLSILHPTNLEFAGEKGQTMFIVGKCPDDETKGCVDKFENEIPGNAFTYLNI